MGVFRPSVRITGPDGRDWEIYAYRRKLRTRGGGGRRGSDPAALEAAQGGRLLSGVARLLGGFVRLTVLALWDAPCAALGARSSDEWTIEAITWQPHCTTYTWTTTADFRGNVLAQVEGQLARGEVPQPRNATYLGAAG